MKRLSKSNIEYLTHVWNFASGCRHRETGICPVPNCWARSIALRFKTHYPQGFAPALYPDALLSPLSLKKPARIGVCFLGDLFGDWVDPAQIVDLRNTPPRAWDGSAESLVGVASLQWYLKYVVEKCPQHRFFFLTKAPWNYQKWDPFPDNAWLGASVCNQEMYDSTINEMELIHSSHNWLSIEPLLSEIGIGDMLDEGADDPPIGGIGIEWVVIGAQTNPSVMPRIEWVREIVEACDRAGVPVWLKNNLGWPKVTSEGSEPFYRRHESGTWILRQELPK